MPLDRKGSRSQGERPGRKKKRQFTGNQYTRDSSTEFASTSAAKLHRKKDFAVDANPLLQYCFISFFEIFVPLENLVKCKVCDGEIKFTKSGERCLGFYLHVTCPCKETRLNSSRFIQNSFEINRKFIFIMRLLGVGFDGVNLFCSVMDICKGISRNAYYGIIDNISVASKAVFDEVIQKAKGEEVEKNRETGNPPQELSVSGDGTWAKRGYSSLFGVVTLIGKHTNKILDLVVKSSYCSECSSWKKKSGTPEYDMWWENHKNKCKADHEGSAGKMEVDGVLDMFQRSETLHGVKYANYIGDGDSKTYKAVTDAKPYGDDFTINKLECVLHVGKRMYKRLKEAKRQIILLRKENAKDDKKPPKKKQKVDRRTKFTDKIIREMSTYYSLAIQRHPDSVENMKKEIWAGFYHKISTDAKPQHQCCDISWCTYLQHEAEQKSYTHKPPLEDDVESTIKHIFEGLTEDALLKRCLGRNNQNNNESYNHSLWQLAPKHIFSGKTIIEIAAWVSASVFNEGCNTLLNILSIMGVDIGTLAVQFAENRDEARVQQARRVSTSQSKEARIHKKQEKSKAEQEIEQAEGLLYGPGIAD